jgi:hypothetical protein
MSIAYLLCEALKDISAKNKLYHRTNIDSFVQIVKSKGLMGYPYGKRMAIDKDGKEEIAVGRKSTFTTVDSTKKYTDLSGSIGNLQIELFIDRIKASVRNNKVVPIAEYNIMNKREIEEQLSPLIVPQHSMNIEKIANALIKNKDEFLGGTSGDEIKRIRNFVEENFPNSTKKVLSSSKWEPLRGAVFRYSVQSSKAREGEERINLPRNNKIPLDPELMQIRVLTTFKIDFKDYAKEFIHLQPLKDLLQAIKNPVVVKDATQSRMVNYIMKAIRILQERGTDTLLNYYGLSKQEIKDGNFKRNVSANL